MSYISLFNQSVISGDINTTNLIINGTVDFTNASITGLVDNITTSLINSNSQIQVKDGGVTDIKIVSVSSTKITGYINISGSVIYFTLPLNMGSCDISNVGTLTTSSLNVGSSTGFIKSTSGSYGTSAIAESDVTNLSTDLLTLYNKTQNFGSSGQLINTLNANYQNISFLNNITTNYATIGSDTGFVKLSFGIVGTSAIAESDVTNLSTDLTTLNNKTQKFDTSGQISATIIPSANLFYNIGDGTHQLNTVYTADVQLGGFSLYSRLGTFLPYSGGTMTGDINCGTHNISNVGTLTTSSLNVGSSTGFIKSTSGSYGASAIAESDVTNLSTDLTTLNNKTQNQTAIANNTTFAGTLTTDILDSLSGNDLVIKRSGSTLFTLSTLGCRITGSIANIADNSNSCGTSTLRFTKVYTLAVDSSSGLNLQYNASTKCAITTNGMTITGVLIPDADNTRAIGGTITRFTIIYVNTVDSSAGVQLNFNGFGKLLTTTNGITITGTALPSTDLTVNLGSASNRWNYLYAAYVDGGSAAGVNLNFNSATKLSTISTGITVFGNVAAGVDNTNTLGLTGTRYLTVYATNVDSSSGWNLKNNNVVIAAIDGTGLTMSSAINCANNNINLPIFPDKVNSLMNIQGSTMALSAGVTSLLTPSGGTVTSINATTGITNTTATFLTQYTLARTRIMNVTIQLSISSSAITTLTIFSSLNATTTPPATGAKSQIQMTAIGTVYNLTLIDQVSAAQNSTFRVGMTSSVSATITLVYASMRIVGELN